MASSISLTEQDKETIQRYIDEKIESVLTKVIKPLIDSLVEEKLESAIKTTRKKQKQSSVKISAPQINSFGCENYDHMLRPYLVSTIKSSNDFRAITQFIVRDLYFNPEAKHNHNVYIPLSTTYRCIRVFSRGKWRTYEMEAILMRLVSRANDVLQHYIVGCDDLENTVFKNEIGKKKYEMLKDYTNLLDNLEKFADMRDKIINDTEHTVLTNQHVTRCASSSTLTRQDSQQ